MGKYGFVVPTIMNRPELETRNVEKIAREFPDCTVYFVCNTEDEDFDNYTPSRDNIKKMISGKKYSIAKALNEALYEFREEEYYVFVQSDVTFTPPTMELFERIAEADPQCGVIGIRKHSNFNRFNKKVDLIEGVNTYKTLWTDGIMFFKMKLFSVGYFNEAYRGDKESQEFCYKRMHHGYNNYYVDPVGNCNWNHDSLGFRNKGKGDTEKFLKVVEKSKERFRKSWVPWEEKQKHLFV